MRKTPKHDISTLRKIAFPNMTEEEREEAAETLREHLEVCHRIYERKKREGTWYWPPDDFNPR